MVRRIFSLLILMAGTSAWAQVPGLDCEMRANNLYFSAKTFNDTNFPFNLASDGMQLIKGSADYQLFQLAYSGLEQGHSETQIVASINNRCQAMPASLLDEEQVHFYENEDTEGYKTACGGLMLSLLSAYEADEEEWRVNVAANPGPRTNELVTALLAQKAQGKPAKEAIGTVFALCDAKSEQDKRLLAKEYFAE
ncbi:hypothetical protein P2G88_01420 [Aliiglaciecola sp. CAU 1673]|uniref:hypothetical protein n=1 Tax=Aliiglaciecola sp. CAU 1673 TaxID=3032595 RepID=UPI0023DBAFC2|nr:hypothetical protein [Aliiglaciecola sp. CAU 1673]MDF2176911.1 hypothetical protein [Aliiglaciecola sp. CAU 1673]